MPAARPEFIHVSEAEVWAAIDNDPDGRVAAEVTRLIAQHTMRLKACVDQNRSMPGVLLQIRVRCPIERVAVLMMADAGIGVGLVSLN
jgi:hypothetical protein